jgi:hypothetical protein
VARKSRDGNLNPKPREQGEQMRPLPSPHCTCSVTCVRVPHASKGTRTQLKRLTHASACVSLFSRACVCWAPVPVEVG